MIPFCKDCKFCQKTGHTPPPQWMDGQWQGWLCTEGTERYNPVTGAKDGGIMNLCKSEREHGTRCGPDGKAFQPEDEVIIAQPK